MTIDWVERVAQIKKMAEELDYWALRTPGRGHMVLGRIADDLRQMAAEIDQVLNPKVNLPPPPEWIGELAYETDEAAEAVYDDAGEIVDSYTEVMGYDAEVFEDTDATQPGDTGDLAESDSQDYE